KKAAIHNQAIMEFGSQYCKPMQPNCSDCIFNSKCIAFKENLVDQLPIKGKKTKVKLRYFNFLLIADGKKRIQIEKRKTKDIWQGLYQFPLIESKQALSQSQVLNTIEAKALLKNSSDFITSTKTYKHLLTHQIIYAQFLIFKTKANHPKNKETLTIEKLTTVAFPRLIEIFLNEHSLEEII
ncbi:MAG: NUDIX domain-containing protein, partial [Bacteroidota bacterium]